MGAALDKWVPKFDDEKEFTLRLNELVVSETFQESTSFNEFFPFVELARDFLSVCLNWADNIATNDVIVCADYHDRAAFGVRRQSAF